jgi:Lon protease-like protein
LIQFTDRKSRPIKRDVPPSVNHPEFPRIIAGVMKIPLFPLDVVLFPGAALPLHIFEERYKVMIAECLANRGVFGVVRVQPAGLAVIGSTARVAHVLKRYNDGSLDILCEGLERFEIELLDESRPFLQAEADHYRDNGAVSTRREREECAGMHFEVLELTGVDTEPEPLDLDEPVSFRLASALPVDLDFKQHLLCLRSDAERTERLLDFYNNLLPKLRRGAQTTRVAVRNGHVM